MNSSQKRTIKTWCVGIVLCFSGIAGWLFFMKDAPDQNLALSHVTIAVPAQISIGALYVGADQEIFKKYGLDISIRPFLLGRDALQSVLRGEADLAISSDVSFMLAVMKGEKIATAATIFGSRKSMALVARRDRGITKAEDLSGKTIGTIAGTNAQYFFDTLLVGHSVPRASVNIINLESDELTQAIQSGKVDAVTVWHPELAKLEQAFDRDAVVMYDEDSFVYRFVLVGKRDYLDTHGAQVRRVLAALLEATQYIHENSDHAQSIMGKALDIDVTLLSKIFNPNDFYVELDQTLLMALGHETRWAMRQGVVPTGPIPNYLDYVCQDLLEAVQPSAIKIIH